MPIASQEDLIAKWLEKVIDIFNSEIFRTCVPENKDIETRYKAFQDYRDLLLNLKLIQKENKTYSLLSDSDLHAKIQALTQEQIKKIATFQKEFQAAIKPTERANMQDKDFPFLEGIEFPPFSQFLPSESSVDADKICYTFGAGALAMWGKIKAITDCGCGLVVCGARPFGSPDFLFFTDPDTTKFSQQYFQDRLNSFIGEEDPNDTKIREVLRYNILKKAIIEIAVTKPDTDNKKSIMEQAVAKVDELAFMSSEQLREKYDEISVDEIQIIAKEQQELLRKTLDNIINNKQPENDFYTKWNELSQELSKTDKDAQKIQNLIGVILQQQGDRLTEKEKELLENFAILQKPDRLRQFKQLVSLQKHITILEQYKRGSEIDLIRFIFAQEGFTMKKVIEKQPCVVEYQSDKKTFVLASFSELSIDQQGDVFRATTNQNKALFDRIICLDVFIDRKPAFLVRNWSECRQAVQQGAKDIFLPTKPSGSYKHLSPKEIANALMEFSTTLCMYAQQEQEKMQPPSPSAVRSHECISRHFLSAFSCCFGR